MPDLLGATNPVPGYDSTSTNRNIPISPNDTQIQNIPDPSRVGRADARTDQQDAGTLNDFNRIRYDSNFQTFLQRLRETPSLVDSLSKLFMGRPGTVVLSGMSEGIATEMSQVLEMLQMNEQEFLHFLTGQFKTGTRFGGALFALLRSAYSKASSDTVRNDILQFLKQYSDYSSTDHIEGNILRNLRNMTQSIPRSWAENLQQLIAQLENGMAAGDRKGNLKLLQSEIFPYMARYVERTHDLGRARNLLTMLALDISRYENGGEENLFQSFHQLNGYAGLKEQLGGFDDKALMMLLNSTEFARASQSNQFADHLTAAAARALRGEGDAETQEVFKQIVSAMLINESVYMPVNHFIIPLEWDGRMMFSELWVDPDAEEEQKEGKERRKGGKAVKLLFKIDIQSLGFFDIVMTHRDKAVDLRIFCPDQVAPFGKQIEQAVSEILTRNGLTPENVQVRKLERPVALTEVFPKIFEGKNSINVKV